MSICALAAIGCGVRGCGEGRVGWARANIRNILPKPQTPTPTLIWLHIVYCHSSPGASGAQKGGGVVWVVDKMEGSVFHGEGPERSPQQAQRPVAPQTAGSSSEDGRFPIFSGSGCRRAGTKRCLQPPRGNVGKLPFCGHLPTSLGGLSGPLGPLSPAVKNESSTARVPLPHTLPLLICILSISLFAFCRCLQATMPDT